MKAGVKSKNTGKTSLSLWELIDRYQVSNQAAGKSPKTTRWYYELLRALAGYLEAKHHTCDLPFLNMDTVRDYILYLRQKPKFSGHPYTPSQTETLSPRTVQCHVRALKAFASWLHAEGYTKENRLKNLKLPKAPATVMEPLSPEEINKVVSSIDKQSPTGARNHAIIVTLLDSGMRAAEAASITLGNLNLPQGYIKLTGKGSKERIVPIGEHVRRVLWSYIDRVRPKPINPDVNNLFLTTSGRPITVNTMKLLFTRLAKTSGVERLHAHLCRHTFTIPP